MKPGDLVILKGRAYYTGVDTATRKSHRVEEGDIGVFIKRAVPVGSCDYEFSDMYVLTRGTLVACVNFVWSPLDETR